MDFKFKQKYIKYANNVFICNKLEPKRLTFIYPNSTTPPCLLLVSAKLGAKSGMSVDEPIFIYKDGTNEYTDRYARIYESCSLELKDE